tara:strand:+ start:122 stop:301 length:180 start_codon:yes stop_codon:yes gene_type:complete
MNNKGKSERKRLRRCCHGNYLPCHTDGTPTGETRTIIGEKTTKVIICQWKPPLSEMKNE